MIKQHRTHGNKDATFDMLRVLIGNGCREDTQNIQGQTYVTYSTENHILSESELQEALSEVRMEGLNKTNTVETSLEERKSSLAQDE